MKTLKETNKKLWRKIQRIKSIEKVLKKNGLGYYWCKIRSQRIIIKPSKKINEFDLELGDIENFKEIIKNK